MKEEVIIYGIGSFAELMNYYLKEDSNYKVCAFTVDKDYINCDSFINLPLIDFENINNLYPPSKYKMFIAIGYKNMRNRKLLFDKAKSKGYELINYISSKSIIYNNLKISENNVIMGNVNIEPFVTIGDNNIIWSDTLIGHNARINSHNYISAKCLIAGDCKIEDLCFIGNGVVMINNLKIRNETYIIAGSTLLKSTEEYCRYIGFPAKIFGSNHKESGIIIER